MTPAHVSINKDIILIEDDTEEIFTKEISTESFFKPITDSIILPSSKLPSYTKKSKKIFIIFIIVLAIMSLLNLHFMPKQIQLGEINFDFEKFSYIQRLTLLSILTTVAYIE